MDIRTAITIVEKAQKPLSSLPVPVDDAFKAWFAGSKAVDRKGMPLLCFHGTLGDITAFDGERSNSKSKTGVPKNSFYFTAHPDVAASYAGQYTWMTGHKEWKDGGNVMPVYLSVKRPMKIDARGDSWNQIFYKDDDWNINDLAELARSKRYDGLIVKNVHDRGEGLSQPPSTTIVVFSPNQIKSAFNRGTWDAASDHIVEGAELMEQITAFHGSQMDNPEFRIGHTGENSHTFGHYDSTRHGVFFSNNPEFAAMYGSVKQYDLNINSTYVADRRRELIYDFVDTLDAFSEQERSIFLNARNIASGSWPLWHLFEDELGARFVAFMVGQGYDSMSFEEANENDDGDEIESTTIVVFDPGLVGPGKPTS
jgi:hypothetical protein